MPMRIATTDLYENAASDFNSLQLAIAKSINKISSGVGLTSPADNPAASAEVLLAKQSDAVNTQYGANRVIANSALSAADAVLSGVTQLMHKLSSGIVAAGNGTLNASDRQSLAQQFQSQLEQMMDLANQRDPNGNYIFSGTMVNVAPYQASDHGVQYKGNQIPQSLQVSSFQQLPTTLIGSQVFGNIITSSHPYFGMADNNNVSNATISGGTVSNLNAVTLDNYKIEFIAPNAYDVINTSNNTTVSHNNAYVSGNPFIIDGITFTISNGSGANASPAAGDQFFVQPGNQNIFQVLRNVIDALGQPISTTGDQANLARSLKQGNESIQGSLDNVLKARNGLGNQLQQIGSLNDTGDTMKVIYQNKIDTLEGIDYAKEISQLLQQQIAYEASQRSFASASRLSLLNLIA